MELEEAQLKTASMQGTTGTKRSDYEIDLDPTWTLAKLLLKVKEDIMQSSLAVKDAALIDQMKIYLLENSEFTTLDNTKTCSDQNVKAGGHLLFTRTAKEALVAEKYSFGARRE